MARLTKFIRVKMNPKLRAKVQEFAEREERSFAGQLRFIMKRWLALMKSPEYAEAFLDYVEEKKEAESREQSKVLTRKGRVLRLVAKETGKQA